MKAEHCDLTLNITRRIVDTVVQIAGELQAVGINTLDGQAIMLAATSVAAGELLGRASRGDQVDTAQFLERFHLMISCIAETAAAASGRSVSLQVCEPDAETAEPSLQ